MLSPKRVKKRRVEVEILGQRMLLKADQDPGKVERLAAYVKRKVDEVSAHGPVSSSKIAVLAALNIAEDYFEALEDARVFREQVAEKSRRILKSIED